MKFPLKYIALSFILMAVIGCESEARKKDRTDAKQKENQKELQKQLDVEFGEYSEEVKPNDRAYYKAYDKALALWKIPFHELYIQTSLGKAHVIACGPKNAGHFLTIDQSETVNARILEFLDENSTTHVKGNNVN